MYNQTQKVSLKQALHQGIWYHGNEQRVLSFVDYKHHKTNYPYGSGGRKNGVA